VSGSYRTPFWINLAGFYNSRAANPFIANIQTRAANASITNVYLDELGQQPARHFRRWNSASTAVRVDG